MCVDSITSFKFGILGSFQCLTKDSCAAINRWIAAVLNKGGISSMPSKSKARLGVSGGWTFKTCSAVLKTEGQKLDRC